jgi:hypothetical protein
MRGPQAGCLLVALAVSLGSSQPATADPIHLGTILSNMGGGGGRAIGGPVITSMSFALFYDSLTPVPGSVCIGCDVRLPLEWLGTLDFTIQGNPSAEAFVSRLTDGVDDTFYSGLHVFEGDTFVGGVGGGMAELLPFGSQTILTGWDIDFVRLTVLEQTSSSSFETGWDLHATFEWEFWGSGEPALPDREPVPEPGTLALLANGLAVVGIQAMRRFRRRRIGWLLPAVAVAAGVPLGVGRSAR